MTLDTIQELLSRRPFDPFQVVTSSGKVYDIRHPEMAWPIRNGIYVGLGGRGKLPDRAAFVSLLHISAVEMSGNGSKKHK
ncbi:MAG TPA: hypothetical protein VHX86_08990 [Tepidisphaeraceae bacterium]|jgi:hypothetical protein|nr:hypothetical protein [Tepidisphaeraceae bacterium]